MCAGNAEPTAKQRKAQSAIDSPRGLAMRQSRTQRGQARQAASKIGQEGRIRASGGWSFALGRSAGEQTGEGGRCVFGAPSVCGGW